MQGERTRHQDRRQHAAQCRQQCLLQAEDRITSYNVCYTKLLRLAGLGWSAPRCLDVRFLVNLLAPNLPDFSLDTIASWAGVEVHDRHSALGDAIATAELFVVLIPRLREAGIRTLAELERACERFSETAMQETRIGWLDVHEARRSRAVLARIDSFA